jgi:chromatin segregation and condensation protein Rec8/ScpA/Scc1 (kleisin family)
VSVAQRAKNKPELKIVVSNALEAPAVEPVPEQVEMPFAIVNGEPVTQMPKDLYIPPQAMEVFLEAFEGPLDLLLYLIRRQNLNILDIPLAEITRQYMKYIEVMTELQLELAGEYMVMAATLAEIKSRMLLPRPKVDPQGNEEDPRAELVRRLQEYERFKRAAESIDSLPRLERDVWQTSADLKDRKVVRLLPTVTLQEMLLAFKDVVVRSEMFAHHHIQRERLSVRERMANVLAILEQANFVEFVRLFSVEEGRMGVTVTFMALLELVREGLIEIVQAEPFAPIHVRAAGAGRKLHVVGGNEALAAVALADESAAVVADTPAVGLVEGFTETVLDPNFIDDDDDPEDGLLEGVDDVGSVSRSPEVGLAASDAPASTVASISVLDEFIASASADGVAYPAAVVAAASVDVSAVDLAAVPTFPVGETGVVIDEWASSADAAASHVDATGPLTAAPHQASAVVALESSTAPADSILATDIVGAAVESVLVAARTEVLIPAGEFHDSAVTAVTLPTSADAATSYPVTSVEPSETTGLGGSLDVASLPVDVVSVAAAGSKPPSTTDVVADSVASVLADVPNIAMQSEPWLDQPAVIIEPISPPAEITVADPALALDEAGAVVELDSHSDSTASPELAAELAAPEAAVSELATPQSNLSPSATDLTSALFDLPVFADGLATTPTGEVFVADELTMAPGDTHTPADVRVPVEAAAPAFADETIAVDEPSPAVDAPSALAAQPADEIAVTFEPSLADELADETIAAVPAIESVPSVDEGVVTVDPAVFDAPVATVESESSGGSPPKEEPPAFDVEYEVSAEDFGTAEEAAADDAISLIGDTSVAGDVSLVGDESVSGGPAVEVQEFAFDDLPALDEAGHADQQPAAGAQTVVEKLVGTDEPPSPGEESDD